VIASVLAVMSFASANVTLTSVKVNTLETLSSPSVSVLAGSSVPVTVSFTSSSDESNVRLRAEFQGPNGDVQSEVFVGNVEAGQTYIQSLNLQVPADIGSVQSTNVPLVLTVWSASGDLNQTTITLRDQRQSYNVGVMSLNTVDNANAGALLPVDVVLKNTGYSQLNDLYVTVSIPALNVQRTVYFGDINDPTNSNDTKTGTVYLQLPYNASP